MSDLKNRFGRTYNKNGPVKQAEKWLDYSSGLIASNKGVARPRSAAWTKTKFPATKKQQSFKEPQHLYSVEEWSETHPEALHPGFLDYTQQNLWLHAVLSLDRVQEDLATFDKETDDYKFIKIPVEAEDVVKTAGDQLETMRNGGWWKNGVRLGITPIKGVFLEIRHDANMLKVKKSEQAYTPFLIYRFWPLLYSVTTNVTSIPYDSE